MFRFSYVTDKEHTMPNIFEAIGDPTRREILSLLIGRSLPAGEIARRFSQQRPAISKHLTVLKKAGVLIESRSKQQRLYSLRPAALTPIQAWLEGLMSPSKAPLVRATARKLVATAKPMPQPRFEPRIPQFDPDFD